MSVDAGRGAAGYRNCGDEHLRRLKFIQHARARVYRGKDP